MILILNNNAKTFTSKCSKQIQILTSHTQHLIGSIEKSLANSHNNFLKNHKAPRSRDQQLYPRR